MKRGRSIHPIAKMRIFGRRAKDGSPRIAALLVFVGLATLGRAGQQVPMQNLPAQYIERSYPTSAANTLPDKNAQMQMQEKLARKKNLEAANLERKRQIDNDSTKLVELAKELKAAVDVPGKNALSPDAARKAALIERLARGIEEKMKLSENGN